MEVLTQPLSNGDDDDRDAQRQRQRQRPPTRSAVSVMWPLMLQ